MAEAYRQFAVEGRWQDCRIALEPLERLGALVEGMTLDEATDVVWSTLSPDTHHLLVHVRGWTTERFAEHAASVLASSLLGQLRPSWANSVE